MTHAFLYQHVKRAEWGYGAVTDTKDDRTTFKFDDGTSRTITRAHMHMMQQVELDEPEATDVRKRIARHARSSAIDSTGKPKRKKVAKRPVAAVAAVVEETE